MASCFGFTWGVTFGVTWGSNGVPAANGAMLGRVLDIYDGGDGSLQVGWFQFAPEPADSYNVYVNGVLNQNVTEQRCEIVGLLQASYNGAVVTPAPTYTIKVVSVVGGLERESSFDTQVTVQPTSLTLVTSMKRIFPFPNSGLG